MRNNLTFKNERSYFTIEDVDSSSQAFIALKSWASNHCSLKFSSDKEFVIENDSISQARLRGCRMFAIQRKLKASIITPLEEAI